MKKTIWSLVLVLPFVLSACGKKKEEEAVVVGAPVVATTCTPGQVIHPQYGCLAPVPGQQGYGLYNGSPVQCGCWSGTAMTMNGCYEAGTNGMGNIPNNGYQYNQQYGYHTPYNQPNVNVNPGPHGGLPGNTGSMIPFGYWSWNGYRMQYRYVYYYSVGF